MLRWKLFDPFLSTEYTFNYNPSEGGQESIDKRVGTHENAAPDSRLILYQGRPAPDERTWKMHVYSIAERDAFLLWARKPYQLRLTDDLGEITWVYIDKVTPEPRKNTANYELRLSYAVHAWVLDIPV